MGTISDIREILKEIPLPDVLRVKLEASLADAERLEQENIYLKEKEFNLEEANSKLHAAFVKERETKDNFVEHLGVFFKRKPEGGYHETPYCPGCKLPLTFGGDFPFGCDRCGLPDLGFYRSDLPDIMKDLPE